MTGEYTFGKYLKKYREMNNLTVRDLSRMTEVSQPYLSQLEGGKVPSIKTIKKLAHGMSDNPIVRVAILKEMLSIAGYPIDSISVLDTEAKNQNEQESVKQEEIINEFLSEIKELRTKLHKLETDFDLNTLEKKDLNIKYNNVPLSSKEKIALQYFLVALKAIREETEE